MYEVDYWKLREYAKERIIEEYGGLTKFTRHQDFRTAGFENSDRDRNKVISFMSNKQGLKSVPVLEKILSLWNITVDTKKKVEYLIFVDKDI